jgi:hypothetical protein
MISSRHFFIALTVLACTATGCSEKDQPACVLSTMEDVTPSGLHDLTTITRNDRNKISGTVLFNWAGNTIPYAYTLDDSGNIIMDNSARIYYKYDHNNRLIESRSGTGNLPYGSIGSDPLVVKTYDYNSNDQLVTVTEQYTNFGTVGQKVYTRYSYTSFFTRNVTKAITFDASSRVMGITSYEYDRKPNAERGFFPSIEPDNNVTKWTFEQEGSQTISVSYSYEYNEAGYPSKRTTARNNVRIYSYSNCK